MPPSFLATTPSLDGGRDWWHLPDLGACLILAPNAALPPIRATYSDGSWDNAPSPSPEPRRLTFQGCRSAILTSSSLAVARPPDHRLRPRDPPDSPTSLSTATSITHLLHADKKARPPLSPRPPTTRLLNKDLSKHPVDGFSAGLVDDSNVFEWQVTIIRPPDTL
uniref:UBC core domain-containing protein n=2 Tax=Zea mays TaxID=4577 RepID=A0A804PXY2_MAIZE